MSTGDIAWSAASRPVTRRNRVGLGFAVVLGLVDLASAAFVDAAPAPGEERVTMAVKVLIAALGVGTLVGAGFAWARRSRGGLRVAAATRMLSVVLTVPAFLQDGMGDAAVVANVLLFLVTLLVVSLLLSRR